LTCHMNYKLAIFNKCLTLKHVVHLLGHIKVLSNIESEDKQFLSVKKKDKNRGRRMVRPPNKHKGRTKLSSLTIIFRSD
jgi:hypothetical protein